jgi:hypothetical protein
MIKGRHFNAMSRASKTCSELLDALNRAAACGIDGTDYMKDFH